jgi:hypothetical protein
MAHRKHHHRYHRRRSNPFGVDKNSVMLAAWGVAGGVGAQALPAIILPAQNTGFMGYGLNIISAIALKMLGDGMLGKNAGDGMLTGGLIATGLRIVKDQFGASIPGLGAYWQSYLPNFPAASNPYGQMTNPSPAVVAAAAAGSGGKGMSGSRFQRSRFGGRGI